MTNFNNTITINFSQTITKYIPESAQKASLIDIPTSLTHSYLSGASPKIDSLSNLALAASVSYHLRTEIKHYLMEECGLNKYTAGIIAGAVGGFVRYKLSDQVPLIGAINNALYETCNNFEVCSNNLIVASALTIAVEGLDAVAQSIYKYTIEKKPIESYYPLFIGGAKVGTIVSAFVGALYVPVVTNDFTYIDHISNFLSFGGESKPTEEL